MQAVIAGIECSFPENRLSNSDLSAEFTEWPAKKIEEKTGIAERRIASEGECSSDLGVAAALKLFAANRFQAADIDYILLCTQSPDYFLPTTACLVQERLGIPTSCGALDFNLGCSGFVFGLSLAKGLIETNQARTVLLLTAETYSKFMHPRDRATRPLFGDGAAATIVQGTEVFVGEGEWIGPFVFGTDGRGAGNLIVQAGGMRFPGKASEDLTEPGPQGNWRNGGNLYMNGPEIFAFTLEAVPQCVKELLQRSNKRVEQIDLFVFHQANKHMLEYLRKKLGLPAEKFLISMRDCGNTVSSTIPIALRQAAQNGQLQPGSLVMLIGFGVGYSWAGTLIRWFG